MATASIESRLDDAARAGWLYFIAGNTQDEIARKLKISRPAAQRLVSLALEKRLITFRLEHPIAACMELSKRLTDRYHLKLCDVVPTDPHHLTGVQGVAASARPTSNRPDGEEAAHHRARHRSDAPRRGGPNPADDCPHHKLVSLVGNIAPDGSASFFDTLTRLADLTQAPHYPIPLPVVAASPEECNLLVAIERSSESARSPPAPISRSSALARSMLKPSNTSTASFRARS
jgi:DNA-binding transcriptional regulator LsrR (DeoR family)